MYIRKLDTQQLAHFKQRKLYIFMLKPKESKH